MNVLTSVSERLRSLSAAQSDVALISISSIAAWVVIERTELCTEFFEWVAENPEYEADSVILAFLLAAVGVVAFARRRFSELKVAVAARTAAESHIRTLAYTDSLTGLGNRRALLERLDGLTAPSAPKTAFGLTIIDLDRFKAVNDSHGHLVGDALLVQASNRMKAELGDGELLYRMGGDEFAIISEVMSDRKTDLLHTAERITKAISQPFEDSTLVHHIGASAGIALFPRDASETGALLSSADMAMYHAKDKGRGRCEFYSPQMDEEIRERNTLEQEMRASLSAGEFIAHYQPIVELPSGELRGFELLARWNRTDGKLVGPDRFIPIAEDTGLINEIMLQMLEQFCKDARNWPEHLTVSVNLSPMQFKDIWLSEKILAVLLKNGISPRRLAVEVTESAIISDEENAISTIKSLRNQGVSISLDDFGTGYSSLHYLRTLPLDKLKIDRSFILSLMQNEDSAKIVNSVIGLAANLGLVVVAEGVETADVAERLASMGCAEGQGYHFSRPVAASAILRLLQQMSPFAATSADRPDGVAAKRSTA